jgi:hypothetical protein
VHRAALKTSPVRRRSPGTMGNPMTFAPLPRTAAWRHENARAGFEVVVFTSGRSGTTVRGTTTAVEAEVAWVVGYHISLDAQWRTTRATIRGLSADGSRDVVLDTDGPGLWRVDGAARPDLDGCLDVDLESSACTNTLPVHRLNLGVGRSAEAPAVYVRAADLAVERLEQRYARVDAAELGDDDVAAGAPDDPRHVYDYRAPRFDFETRLVYDDAGLVLTYPGIATRAH